MGESSSLLSSLWLLAKRVCAGAVFGITLSDRVGSVATMHGRSMEPTLHPAPDTPWGADLLFLEKLSLRTYAFSRGDVVVFRSPLEPKTWMVKRLIALQGDWVTVPGTYEILQVPKGHCWVEGDNGEISLDSKSFGPVIGTSTRMANIECGQGFCHSDAGPCGPPAMKVDRDAQLNKHVCKSDPANFLCSHRKRTHDIFDVASVCTP